MRSRPSTSSFARSSVLPLAACASSALAGLLCTAPARAAVDDMSGMPSPIESAPAPAAPPQAAPHKVAKVAKVAPKTAAKAGVRSARTVAATAAKATHRLADDVLEAERAAVAMLRGNVVSPVMDGSWRQDVNAPRVTRATSLVGRTVSTDLSSPVPAAAPNSPLGARWRVVHGDASSHVPSASWMPDMQSVDTHVMALRPVTNLSGEWALPNDFSLGVMPGIEYDVTAQGRRQANGTFAVTLGKGWSPQWRTFVDMARDRMGSLQMAGASTTMNAGVSYLAAPGVKIDVAVTHGLDEAAPPFQAGLGLSSSF